MTPSPVSATGAASDTDLVAAARGGSDPAFAELVRRYQGQVERVVIRMVGPGDEAEDVAQETFIRFHGALRTFRGDASVGTYLTRIAMNLSLNALRRRRWQLRRFVSRDVSDTADTAVYDAGSDDRAIASDQRARIERALGRLSTDQRAVVVCRMLEDCSTRETAELLGIPEGTVMSRLTRALERLRRELQTEGIDAA